MTETTPMRTTTPPWRTITALGLAAGAAGILLLYFAGLEFPFFPPPGMIIATVGALLTAFVPWRWITLLGPLLAAFYWVGLFGSGAAGHLAGDEGAVAAVGIWVQMIGVTVAGVTGVLAVRRGPGRG